MTTTWMCDNGYHGSAEIRRQSQGDNVWLGYCAGSIKSILDGTESFCDCECHASTLESEFVQNALASIDD